MFYEGYEGYEGYGLNEDLAAIMEYVRGIRIPPPGGPPPPPAQRRRVESDSSSEEEDEEDSPSPPPGDVYFTLAGDEYGVPFVVPPDSYMNLIDDRYLRNLARFMPSRENLNDGYRPKREVDKLRLQRFFNLPQTFVDSFTPNWGVLTVFQFNKTKDQYYLMVVIHNGVYNSELEVILHMSYMDGDLDNIKIFEASTYETDTEIPIGRFNVDWNDFTQAMQDHEKRRYLSYGREYFPQLYRKIQYMLLSFYIREPPPDAPMGLGRDGVSRLEQQPWFSPRKTDELNTFINEYGANINCYMYVHKQQVIGGRQVLVEDIIHH